MSETKSPYMQPCPDGADLISRQDAISAVVNTSIPYCTFGRKSREYNALKRDAVYAIKELPSAEPEPVCEDCISRQDVMEALDRIGGLDTEADREYAKGIFDGIPPVTPTERTGEWVNSKGEPVNDRYSVYCSRCKAWSEYRGIYCGNCGARMKSGETESEGE